MVKEIEMFEELQKEITKEIQRKNEYIEEIERQIKEVKIDVAQLGRDQLQALKEEKAEEYTLISGKIAVAEAKQERLKAQKSYNYSRELVKGAAKELNEVYEAAVDKCAKGILKTGKKLIEQAEEIAKIFAEYQEISFLLRGIADADEVRNLIHDSDAGDVNSMVDFLYRVVQPGAENADQGGRSVFGYAYRLNYDGGKGNE